MGRKELVFVILCLLNVCLCVSCTNNGLEIEDNIVIDNDIEIDDNEIFSNKNEDILTPEVMAQLIDDSVLEYPSSNEMYTYNVYTNYIEITGYIGDVTEEIEVPAEIEDLPVLVIKRMGINGCISLILPDTVYEISDGAFWYIETLEEVRLSENLTIIGEAAFRECNIQSIIIPANVKIIDDWAFVGCIYLDSVEIEEGEQELIINDRAFGECFYLADIIIPERVVAIDNNAFAVSYFNIEDKEGNVVYTGERTLPRFTDFKIHCKKGSYAIKFAVDNGYTVNIIE